MRIGVVGGGQLGLMIAQAAKELGHSCVALDPAADAPAFVVCESHIVARYDDVEALTKLCEMCDVVTYEFENIPAEVLEPLCERYNIKQGCAQLLKSQDRLVEKQNAEANGLTAQRYAAVETQEQLREATSEIGLPAVLKSRRMGYDGKGQMVLRCEADLAAAAELLSVPCILEEFVKYDYEVSTVVVRSADSCTIFPVGQNIHRRGVLDLSIVPAAMSAELRERIERGSVEFMERCGYYGILAIEYFIRGEEVIFNEMAPRPHNSGHYTIEGCTSSQFSELVRYLTDEPLKGAELVAQSVVMKNILGEDMASAEELAAEEVEGCYVHIYGKSECKVGRKMAHITFVGVDEAEYRERYASRFVE
ncbi:MAG: 5-(carboxyamino)imidazole ribonucleotide synthase [Rikenellaceae bacterium]